jgi:hypothetical protein
MGLRQIIFYRLSLCLIIKQNAKRLVLGIIFHLPVFRRKMNYKFMNVLAHVSPYTPRIDPTISSNRKRNWFAFYCNKQEKAESSRID